MTARLVGALLAVLALVTTGCSVLGGGDDSANTSDGSVLQIPVSERDEPIDLTGDDLEGEELSFADLRGRVVVVNVWGAWCTPCRVEQPDLVEAAKQTSDTADFVGINIRDPSIEKARAFVRAQDVPYPSLHDPDGEALLTFSAVVAVRSPPTTFVLDTEGRIAAAIFGPLPSVGTLVDLVDEVGAEASGETGG